MLPLVSTTGKFIGLGIRGDGITQLGGDHGLKVRRDNTIILVANVRIREDIVIDVEHRQLGDPGIPLAHGWHITPVARDVVSFPKALVNLQLFDLLNIGRSQVQLRHAVCTKHDL